ncbi:TetR/AcrR family transcriptional regulator [Paenibacillus cellulositrophicus]|uniref:TetR/AcrR family transcriptional regulator n=1 Tax=Paenibacillus cellulositrophicus TaxID=562959 RepID=UPI00126741BD|nr:TetR/AcrR family transcriptional regulator [Paenibacillus cellulositrophicus]
MPFFNPLLTFCRRPVYYKQMNNMNSKPSQLHDAREKLLQVGLELIQKGGYGASSIKDVVTEAEVPKGSFYYYFDSKETFAKEVIERYASTATSERTQLLADRDIPPLIRLRRYFETYIQYFADARYKEGCLFGNLSLEMCDHSEVLRAPVVAGFQDWEQDLRAVLQEASEVRQIPAPFHVEMLAAFILNSWEGALVRMRAEQSVAPLQLFITTVFDQMLQAKV